MKALPRNSSPLLQVVPIVVLGTGKSPFFSYKASEAIRRGSVVSISFGRRTVRGIVWDRERGHTSSRQPSQRPFQYKNIGKILADSFLSEESLQFAESFSRNNGLPLGAVLSKFLPGAFSENSIPSERNPRARRRISRFPSKEYSLTPTQEQTAKDIVRSKNQSLLLFGPPASGKTLVYLECIRKKLAKGGQALVVFPDRSILLQEKDRYERTFGNEAIGVFHAGMKASERSTLIRQVQNGNIRILLGTRSSIFLPFRKLSLVIVDDAGASSYSRLGSLLPDDAHRSARELAEAHRASCLLGSSTPPFDLFFKAKESGALLALPAPPTRTAISKTINLRFERWKKRSVLLSEELALAIDSALTRKEQVLLFVSREGMSSFSVCAECKAVFRCPECQKPFSYRSEGDYYCERCRKSAGSTPSCPDCGSLAFRHLGAGTERVERDIIRRFPRARTVRYDRKSATKKTTLDRLSEFLSGSRDILITTERGIRGWDLPHLSLVGIIDADNLLGSPSWNADEIALGNMIAARGRVGRRPEEKSGTVLIQTFHPENPIFLRVEKNDLEGFFQTIEDERRTLLYPPFGSTIELSCRLASEKKLSAETLRVYELLRSLAESSDKSFRVTPPSPIRRNTKISKGRLFERHMTIRVSTSEKQFSKKLESFLETLPSEWHRTKDAS